jgi:hypothetical protein
VTALVRNWLRNQRRRPVDEIAKKTKPARTRPDPIVTSGMMVAPVKANNGATLGAAPGVVEAEATTATELGLQLGLGTTMPAALVMQASTLAVGALKVMAPRGTPHV